MPWQRRIAALFLALSGGTLMTLLLVVFSLALQGEQGGLALIPQAMVVVPFIIFPAIVPALLAGALLLRMRWLRLHHFLAAGGASGVVSTYAYLLLTSGVKAIQDGTGLLVLAFFAGVAGGASAWLYLKLTKQIPDRPAP